MCIIYIYIYIYIYICIHISFCVTLYVQKTTALYESISCNQYDPRSQYHCRTTVLSMQCSVVVFYTHHIYIYVCVCVCVCIYVYVYMCVYVYIYIYLYSVFCSQNRKNSSRILSAFDKRRLWVLYNKRLSTISHPCIIVIYKIVIMHRVALCLLLESTLEDQNWLL